MTDYCIISVSNDREHYKKTIRELVLGTEHFTPCVNGNTADLKYELNIRGLTVSYGEMFSNGEIGVWLSQFNAWAYANTHGKHLVVFEDDAIPTEKFTEMILKYQLELPVGYDFCSLWVPDNQRGDYLYDVDYGDDGIPKKAGPIRPEGQSQYDFGAETITKVYQGYGAVATLYSPTGAGALMRLARQTGIYTPVDCFLFQETHKNELAGYAPKPEFATAVQYDWAAPSVRVTEGRYNG